MFKNYTKLIILSLLFVAALGFSAHAQDAGVTKLLSPLNNSCGTTAGRVKVLVYNFGGSSISSIPVTLVATGSSSFTLNDTLKSTLGKGGQDTLTFSKAINTYAGGSWKFVIYSNLAGDANRKNDTLTVSITINAIPGTPTGTAGTRCGAGPVTFKAPSTTKGATTYWYTSASSTTPISSGDSLVKNISTTTTLYAASSTGGGFDSLTSSSTGSGTYYAQMFDVKPTNDVTLDSFDVYHSGSGVDTVFFYFKTGSYVGYESSKSAWTYIGKSPISGGGGSFVRINFGTRVNVKAGSLNGICFYLGQNAKKSALGQTNSKSTDTTKNSTMKISTGIIFKSVFSSSYGGPYWWNGRVYYSGGGCTSSMVAVTGVIKEVVKGLKLSKNKTSAGNLNAGTAANPDEICVGDSLKYDLSAPSNLLNSDYGSKWKLTYSMRTAKGSATANYTVISPSAMSNGQLIFTPQAASTDSVYIFTIVATNTATGCDSSFSRYIHVNGIITPSFTVSNICMGKPLALSNKSTPAGKLSFVWDFGNGDTSMQKAPAYKYPAAGSYTITLTAANAACKASTTNAVTIYNAAYGSNFLKGFPYKGQFNDGDVVNPDNACLGDTNTYQLTPPKGLSNSDFGSKWVITSLSFATPFGTKTSDTLVKLPTSTKNGSFTFFPSKYADSVFILTINIRTLPGNCDSILKRYVHIRVKPTAYFGFKNACLGSAVSFIDSSSIKIATVSGWAWDFGDGATSGSKNPFHAYAKAGTYKVNLTAISDAGCTNTVSRTVEEYPRAAVKFVQALACNNGSSSFTDSSSVATGKITAWKWSFGDGGTAATQNAANTYSKSGPYNVKLVTTTAAGCKDSFSRKITVLPRPVPAFTYKNACVGTTIYLANNSTDSSGQTTYAWDFGDNTTSSAVTPQHIYSANGTYTVRLKVTSKAGCSDSLNQTITPFSKPVPDIRFQPSCTKQTVTFADSSAAGTGSTYSWNFGDGNTAFTSQVFSGHAFAKSGTYNVKLVITNGAGCIDSQARSITVIDFPKAGFTSGDVCLGKTTAFTNTSTGPATLTYRWDFGDKSSSSTTESPGHKYGTAGSYKVKLAAINSYGCTDTFAAFANVHALPIVPEWVRVQKDYQVTLVPKDTSLAGYTWYFGTAGGDSSSKKVPTFTYPTADARYGVKLVVTNVYGCSSGRVDSIGMGIYGIDEANGDVGGISVYPNPFEGSTVISYSLKNQGHVRISVADLQGREIAVLCDGMAEPGAYRKTFDAAENHAGKGMYLVKININGNAYYSKIISMK